MGLVDNALVLYDLAFGSSIKDRSWRRIEKDNGSDEYMLLFLGWKASIGAASHLYRRFDDKNLIIYELPNSMLSGDLRTMKESWDEVVYHVKKDIRRYRITALYGLSLGNTLALYASKRCSAKDVYMDLPYHMLAYVIWHGPLTSSVKRELEKNGHTYIELQRFLRPYEPVHNLSDKDYHVFVANCDSIVPRESVEVLLKKMEHYKPRVHIAPFLGHYLGALYSFYGRWLDS